MTRAQLPAKPSFVTFPDEVESEHMLVEGIQPLPSWHRCHVCRARRFIRWYADPAAPRETAELIEYDCPCLDQVETARFLMSCGLGRHVGRYVWGDTQFTAPADKAAIADYVENVIAYAENGRGLFLHGADKEGVWLHGNGKTLHAVLLLKSTLAAGLSGYFVSMQKLLAGYTEGWRSKDQQQWFDRKITNAEVLVIDDVGKENENYTVAKSALDDIFRSRTDNGLCTIVTTNMGRKKFQDRYDSAISSLVEQCEHIAFDGPDFRNTEDSGVLRLTAEQHRTNEDEQLLLSIKRGVQRPWLFG